MSPTYDEPAQPNLKRLRRHTQSDIDDDVDRIDTQAMRLSLERLHEQGERNARDIRDIARAVEELGTQTRSSIESMTAAMSKANAESNTNIRLMIQGFGVVVVICIVAMFGLVGGTVYVSTSAGSVQVNQPAKEAERAPVP